MSRSVGSETNFPNGMKAFPRDVGNVVIKTANFTITAAQCIGSTLIMDSDSAATFTLPLIAGAVDGGIVTIVNNKRSQLLTIDPHDDDGISFGDQVGNGVTVLNTAATAQKGDYITLMTASAASTFWNVIAIGGIWAVGG